ncbi:MAG: aspartate--tRNA ligase [Candidatus Eisenbacteria sp.]|nr:aspartate--tRNA ligase [Candidatus Eisenbacteria bacterium]
MRDWKRTHTCGALRGMDAGSGVVLVGWLHRLRTHGGVNFADLRDRYGMTQVVLRDEAEMHGRSVTGLRGEFVLGIRGRVSARPDGMVNPKMATGEIEVLADEVVVLNESEVPPFVIEDETNANEDLRLKYRYLDLRRTPMKNNIVLRHRVAQAAREVLNGEDFLEVETPTLVKQTPEGARDFLVPSRLQPGKFYALPQSPQLYKQLLMISGLDRYYQLARCLRDEDLRADRQPEHTQIDIEMSFVTEDDVFALCERLMSHLFRTVLDRDLEVPFRRLTYAEAMSRYGSDKPDLRFGLEIVEVGDCLQTSGLKIFQDALSSGNTICAIRVPGAAGWSRKEIEAFGSIMEEAGGRGVLWTKAEAGGFTGGVAKHLDESCRDSLRERLGIGDTDLVLLAADKGSRVNVLLGVLRRPLAEKLGIIPEGVDAFAWVTEFPLFEWSEEEDKWESTHHMFCMPRCEDLDYLDSDPGRVRGQVYDLVYNGIELGSGSIRCHLRSLQEKIMKRVGFPAELAEERFGFLLKAFEHGAPPHGGIALGLDRLVMVMACRETIRDVIAFPKTTTGGSLVDGCPSRVPARELEELGLTQSELKKD